MFEIAAAAVGGGALVFGVARFWPRKRMPAEVAELLAPFRGEHDHDPHISGTQTIGGVKHKQVYCSLCKKRWVEPC